MPHQKVIFIHGLMGSPNEWNEPAAILNDKGFQTYQVSILGHGDLPDSLLGSHTLDAVIADCTQQIKDFAQNQPSILIGHSLGAGFSVLFAAQHPDLVSQMILIGCPFHVSAYTHPWSLLIHPKEVFRKGKNYLPESNTGFRRPKVTVKDFFRFFVDGRRLLKKVQEAAPQVNCPVGLVHSLYDLHVPYENTHKLAKALINSAHITQHTLTQCGHQIFPKSNEKGTTIKTLETICQNNIRIMTV